MCPRTFTKQFSKAYSRLVIKAIAERLLAAASLCSCAIVGAVPVGPVYLGYDQAALDLQYNNQASVVDPKHHLQWYGPASADARARVEHDSDIGYGPLPDQRLDIFRPAGTSRRDRRPVVVYIHGGAWRALGLADSSFPAETFTACGALYVPLGFTLMPTAGTLDEMVGQVRTGVAWVWQNISAYGGDPQRLHLIGHSSGAHLAAMTLVTDWARLYALPPDVIRSGVLASGMYDLEPVRLSYRNEMLRLDRAAEIRNSPCRNLPERGSPILIAYGQKETAEFKRQAESFEAIWRRQCEQSRLVEIEGANHYEVIESLTIPASQFAGEVLAWFELKNPPPCVY